MDQHKTERFLVSDVIRLVRPAQWIKNTVVFAAFFFALGDADQSAGLMSHFGASLFAIILAASLFCVISSGVYVLNDIADAALDRLHPRKRTRPVASGRIAVSQAWVIGIVLLAAGLVGSLTLGHRFAAAVGAYVALQIAYSFWLKRVALVDVMMIAAGFVLRALAGAVVLNLRISPWLILCTFWLSSWVSASAGTRKWC